MLEGGSIRCGHGKRRLFGRVFVQRSHGENGIEVNVQELANLVDQLLVIGWIDGNMISSIVTNFGLFQANF